MPPQTHASMTSFGAAKRRSNDRHVRVRMLSALNSILSVGAEEVLHRVHDCAAGAVRGLDPGLAIH
jgi:hypothetical protein